MLYWLERVPEHVLDKTFMEQHWPHGWSFWTRPTAHAVRYNCKYIQKDMGDQARQGHLAMSKKPPLGALYFQRLAEQYVAQGLAPQTLEYSFPEVTRRKKDGSAEVVPFRLKDRSAELFLDAFCREWERVNPGRQVPSSKLVEEYLDPGAWEEKAGSLGPLLVKPARGGQVKQGPKDLNDWQVAYERESEDGEAKQKRQERAAKLQRDAERLIAAVHRRQGEKWAADRAEAAAEAVPLGGFQPGDWDYEGADEGAFYPDPFNY